MKLKLQIASLASVLLLTACYSVPTEPDFILRINGDYQSVADCAWLKFRTLGGWQKADLPSVKKVELSFGNDVSTAGRIDISSAGRGRTEITSHMPSAVWGSDYWQKRFRPIFAACGG